MSIHDYDGEEAEYFRKIVNNLFNNDSKELHEMLDGNIDKFVRWAKINPFCSFHSFDVNGVAESIPLIYIIERFM